MSRNEPNLELLPSGTYLINNPDELCITFYFATEEVIYPPENLSLMDHLTVDEEIAGRIEATYPDLLRKPQDPDQRIYLDDLAFLLAESSVRIDVEEVDEVLTQRAANSAFENGGHWNESDPTHTTPIPESLGPENGLDGFPLTSASVSIYINALVLLKQHGASIGLQYDSIRDASQLNKSLKKLALGVAFEVLERWAWGSHKLVRNVVASAKPHIFQPLIPYVVHRSCSRSAIATGVMVNPSIASTLSAKLTKRTNNSTADLEIADQRIILDRYIRLMQDAEHCSRLGLTSGAAVLSATASEFLIVAVQNMLDWEDGVTPERGSYWSDVEIGIQKRLSTAFGPRLGGNWDLSREGPLKDWAVRVAELRNRVVHRGYIPTEQEASLSIGATHALLNELADRICLDKARGRFPRTAVMLVGNERLEERRVRTKKIRELQSDPNEPNWQDSFKYWVEQGESSTQIASWDSNAARTRAYGCILRTADQAVAFAELASDEGWARQVSITHTWPGETSLGGIRNIIDDLPSNPTPFVVIKLSGLPKPLDSQLHEKKLLYRIIPNRLVSPNIHSSIELQFSHLGDSR